MTEERFGELVNLYLDREISRGDLVDLREELQANPARRRDFEERRRLQRALEAALDPGVRQVRSSSRGARPFFPVSSFAVGLSMAAALVLSVSLFNPVLRDALSAGRAVERESLAGLSGEDWVDHFDSGRYENGRLRVAGEGAQPVQSLTAQLRLAGLGPETAPPVARMRTISRDQIAPSARAAELPPFLRVTGLSRKSVLEAPGTSSIWPEGFEAALVGY